MDVIAFGDQTDVWRVAHDGGAPQLVIEDSEVPFSGGGFGYRVDDFSISADASTIAFTLLGPQYELYVLDAGGYHQLTNGTFSAIHNPVISGDGTTIVFAGRGASNDWYSIRSDGSNMLALEHEGHNVAPPDLPYDGTLMFYNDSSANGGRLTQTNGAGRLDLFPASPISFGANGGNLSISDDGNKVSFVRLEGGHAGMYVGYLNNPGAVPDAPTIHNIAFDPAAMPRDDPSARVTLTSQISDPQGLADIERTSTDELLEGVRTSGNDCPAYFNYAANDLGTSPDETAGDGVFSSLGQPGSTIDTLDQVTIRVGAQDISKTVVVADTILLIGNAGQMPLLPPTNLQAQPGADSIELAWNPSTSPGLMGYNVYRANSAQGPWTKINAAPATGDSYLDTSNLTAGNSYYYYLTAVDSVAATRVTILNSESAPSNVAFAVFGQLKLFIPDSYGANGDSITLPIYVANANGVEMCAVDIQVTYDQGVLVATGIEKTALTAGYSWAANTATPGVVRASIAAIQGDLLYGEGALFNALFDVVGDDDDTSELAFQVTGTTFYDCRDLVNDVPLDLSDVGVFTVQAAYILGDLNGDGVVNSADAALALEIAVGNVIPTPEQEAAGDMNGDGRINSADAALIMRLAAGLPTTPTVAQVMSIAMTQSTVVSVSVPGDAALPEGGTTWVAVSISDATHLTGADIVLNFDPFIAAATGARTTTLSANFDIEINVPVAGQARISLKPKTGHEDGLTSGSGALLEVRFVATTTAGPGDTSALTLASVRLSDRYGRDFATSVLQVDIAAGNGTLTVQESGYAVFLPLIVR